MTIAFGLIGCGRIADRHIASLAKCEKAQLLAVCDIHPERMDEAERLYVSHSGAVSALTKYADPNVMLRDERIQAVVISTHSAVHADLAKAALLAGKHVVLEKPIALSLQEANDIVSLAESQQRLVQVCHQLRYRPVMKRLRELIVSGAMGKLYLGVVSIRLNRSRDYYEAAKWRGTWDLDGGMLLNQGIHLVDLLQWFMGDTKSVYGAMRKGTMPKQTEDVAAGIVTYKNSAIGVIEANTISHPGNFDNEISLFGEKGTVCLGGLGLNEIRRWSFEDKSLTPCESGGMNEHLSMYEHFIQALEGKPGMTITASDAKRALETIFALYESARTGQTAKLPLKSFSTQTMAQMEGWL